MINVYKSSGYSSVKAKTLSGNVHSARERASARDLKRWQYLSVWNLLRESVRQLSHPRTERTMSLMLYNARSNQSSRKQRCMKTLDELWEFMTDTKVALSERSSTPRPCSLGAHSLIEIATVSSSSSLMWRSWVRMKSGKSLWKHSPKQTAPQPVKQASVAKSSEFEIMTSEGITETSL